LVEGKFLKKFVRRFMEGIKPKARRDYFENIEKYLKGEIG